MDWAPAVLEAALPLGPLFVPPGTVLETVNYLLSRKPIILKQKMNYHLQECPYPQVPSSGALPNAMSGRIKNAVTIHYAENEVALTKKRVGGLITSQVIDNCFNRCELTIHFQGRLAHCPAACPMAIGAARPRRSQSTELPSWKKMHSHTQVSLPTFDRF